MIKVLITDDHPVVRKGIRQILEDDDRISLINEAGSGKEMLNMLLNNRYDIILLDISLPGRSGLEMIGQIKEIQPSTVILILSMHTEEMYAIKAFKSGASGYLSKTSAPEELLMAIFTVLSGERFVSYSLAGKLTDNILRESEKPIHSQLSSRELEVLNLIADGKTVSQIGAELSLSPKTISTYRERLLEKLKLTTTAELIRYAIMEGLNGSK